MSDPYKELATELEVDGIRCYFQRDAMMVISQQVGPAWPDGGNTFWVTNVEGCWYLFTWAPVGYRVPELKDIAALCRTCMGFGDRAMAKVPSEIMDKFRLVEISDEDAECVVGKMDLGL